MGRTWTFLPLRSGQQQQQQAISSSSSTVAGEEGTEAEGSQRENTHPTSKETPPEVCQLIAQR